MDAISAFSVLEILAPLWPHLPCLNDLKPGNVVLEKQEGVFSLANYDFSTLNPDEFELLSNDLLSRELGVRIERFKRGRDLGIDGRFFEGKDACIIQSKHYALSGIKRLLSHLKHVELPKIQKIAPARYILSTSVALSPQGKQDLMGLLSPYITSTEDILGQDDLNALLSAHPDVERSCYKLWIASSEVLKAFLHSGIYNFSEQVIADATENSKSYVLTEAHLKAEEILEKFGLLLITGSAGVGKTTLAEQLCLKSICDGYQFIAINNDIKEALSVADGHSKQVFYFDDFLGRNFLDAIRSNQDSAIVKFSNYILRNKNKRLILTSRTSIFDRGYYLSTHFQAGKIGSKQYIFSIEGYSMLDKAKILYSFLWRGNISKDFCFEIIDNKIYRRIINHKNYNPRILELIVNGDIVSQECSSPKEYIKYIESVLSNPAAAWLHPYETQLDGLARLIVDCVVLNHNSIEEETLKSVYHRAKSTLGISSSVHLPDDFYSVLRPLTSSFIRRVSGRVKDSILCQPFNPSISDFVIHKYLNNIEEYVDKLYILDTLESVTFLKSAYTYNRAVVSNIADLLTRRLIDEESLFNKDIRYIFTLCSLLNDSFFIDIFFTKIEWVREKIDKSEFFAYTLTVPFLRKLLELLPQDEAILSEIISKLIDTAEEYDDLELLSEFLTDFNLNAISNVADKFYYKLYEVFKNGYLETLVRENIGDVAEESGEFDDEDDYYSSFTIDEHSLCRIIAKKTEKLISSLAVRDIEGMLFSLELGEIAAEELAPYVYEEKRSVGTISTFSLDELFSSLLDEKY